MPRPAALSLFLVLLMSLLPAKTAATAVLEEAMSESERRAAGLHKLSDEEKQFLNDWLGSDGFGLEFSHKPGVRTLKAHLQGEFSGWDGTTEFHLDNGQIWRQRVAGQYVAPQRTQPAIEIEKSRFGYYLRIVETGRMVGVRRIK